MLEIARKSEESKSRHNNIEYVTGNIETGEGFIGEYDTIYGSSVLHHVDLDLAMPHVFNALKTGGKIVFTEPNLLNPQIWLERNIPMIRKKLNVSPDETAFVRYSLKKKLLKYGFSNVYIKTFDWLHPLTPTPLIPFVRSVGFLLENSFLIKEISGSLLITAEKN